MTGVDLTGHMRAICWERAKGELGAALSTFRSPEDVLTLEELDRARARFTKIQGKISAFIEDMEANGYME